jgi:flagellar biosynthesis protein FlhG
MARLGHRVILVDGDLGGANLHTMMGLRYPQATLEDFLLRKTARLEDVVLPTPIPGLGLICGADDFLGAANPTYSQKMRLFKHLEELPADFVFIDLGAGTSFNTLDFFNFSPGKIAVFTGYATALQNVYGFIKCALFRKISREFAKEDQVVSLVYNNAAAPGDIASMTDLLAQVRQTSPESLFQLAGIIKPYRFSWFPIWCATSRIYGRLKLFNRFVKNFYMSNRKSWDIFFMIRWWRWRLTKWSRPCCRTGQTK